VVGIIQKDGTGDFTVIILNLSLASPPTARVYDPGNVRSYVGNIHDRAGHAWVLSNLAPGSFEVEVTAWKRSDLKTI